MGHDETASGDVDRTRAEHSGDEDPPEWSESEVSKGPGEPEDVAGVATDRTPGWLGDRTRWLLILVGLVLLFVPEPITSLIGLGFVVGGILLWMADLFG